MRSALRIAAPLVLALLIVIFAVGYGLKLHYDRAGSVPTSPTQSLRFPPNGTPLDQSVTAPVDFWWCAHVLTSASDLDSCGRSLPQCEANRQYGLDRGHRVTACEIVDHPYCFSSFSLDTGRAGAECGRTRSRCETLRQQAFEMNQGEQRHFSRISDCDALANNGAP